MIQIYSEIENSLVDLLEAFLFESEEASRWTLAQKKPTDPFLLSGYFEDTSSAQEAWAQLQIAFPSLASPQFNEIVDADWKNEYKRYLKPWVSRGLHWVPLWERPTYTLPAADKCIWVDAGMAFGTGTHETTQLCAERLLDIANKCTPESLDNFSLIDAGCGSAILAMSAKALGFGSINAFDNDAESVKVAHENLELNSMQGEINLYEGDLISGFKNKKYDVVVANILANVLSGYAVNLVNAVNSNGTLILSGILIQEVNSVEIHFQETLTQLGVSAEFDQRSLGEWSDLAIFIR